MTERDALLAAILSWPGDDTPRLIYADWLEDRGEVERAEFIRVQCELARIQCGRCKGRGTYSLHAAGGFGQRGIPCDMACRAYDLRRRERELCIASEGQWQSLLVALLATDVIPKSRFDWKWHRGFISSITPSWSDFLRHHAALIWSPRQTTECVSCRGTTRDIEAVTGADAGPCSLCHGTGRIPRPFVNTAQPIETVRLTNDRTIHIDDATGSLSMIGSSPVEVFRFDRVKCCVCGDDAQCAMCYGRPLNLWDCEAWPGVGFVMPE